LALLPSNTRLSSASVVAMIRRTRFLEAREARLAVVAAAGEANPDAVTVPVADIVTVGAVAAVAGRTFLVPAGPAPLPAKVFAPFGPTTVVPCEVE
jgi:hypothetical protein